MARNANVSVQSNFTRGLITEATTLNFPQDASVDAQNVVFSRIGDVTRRFGFDLEQGFSTKTSLNLVGSVMVSYLWKAPAGQGNTNIAVVQMGNTLYFYIAGALALSGGLSANTINLDTQSVYNWTSSSPTSNTIAGSGSKTWTVQAGLPVQVGQTVVATSANGGNSMTGTVSTYNASTGSLVLTISSSTGSGTFTAWTFAATALSSSTQGVECQFSNGNGYLFVAHEFCDPFFVTYDPIAITFTPTTLSLKIRDFKGVVDTVSSNTQRPTTLSDQHRYNLSNQGWPSSWVGTSTSSITPATGSKSFTLGGPIPVQIGDRVRIYNGQVDPMLTTAPAGYSLSPGDGMVGAVTAYSFNGTNWILVVAVDKFAGAVQSSWNIVSEPDYLDAWSSAFTAGSQIQYPSNADTWSYFKNAATPPVFDPAAQISKVTQPNTQASMGHFILNPFFEDRAGVSGITTIAVASTGQERPTTVAFYEGRVWYAGVQSTGFNARIFFSQIVTPNNIGNTAAYAYCYQQEDPTDPNFFDLLSDDGGVIDIVDAGTIYKMLPVLNALVVFASNGVWAITGSGGAGFKATDFAIHKISAVYQNSATSFVDVDGIPYWWNFEGIYRITLNPATNAMRVESISLTTIKSFMDGLTEEALNYARGAFDPEAKIIQWIFKSGNSADVNDRYAFDRVLSFNTLSNSFYYWTLNTNVRVNGVISLPATLGVFTANQVTTGGGANNVTTSSGANNVIVFRASSSSVGFQFKYLCTYGIESNSTATFAENISTTYKDWFTRDSVGQNYTSYFVTGWMIKGATQSKFQTNYVRMWTNPANTSTFQIQSYFNYNTTTGSAILPQTVIVSSNSKPRRFKLRGNGLVTQFKVTGVDALPFDIQGWSVFETTAQWV